MGSLMKILAKMIYLDIKSLISAQFWRKRNYRTNGFHLTIVNLEKFFCRQSLSLLQIFNSQNRLKSMLKNNQLLTNLRKRTQNQKKLFRTLKNPYQQYKHLKNQRKK